MLIEGDKKIGFITSRQDFARTDPHLKDRWSARNRGRDRHVSHHILVAASGKSRQKRAGRLNSVLRISRKANYGVLNVFRPEISAIRSRMIGFSARFGGNGRWLDSVGHE